MRIPIDKIYWTIYHIPKTQMSIQQTVHYLYARRLEQIREIVVVDITCLSVQNWIVEPLFDVTFHLDRAVLCKIHKRISFEAEKWFRSDLVLRKHGWMVNTWSKTILNLRSGWKFYTKIWKIIRLAKNIAYFLFIRKLLFRN